MLPRRYGRRLILQVPSKFMFLSNYTASHPRDDNHHSLRSEDLRSRMYRLQTATTGAVFAPCHPTVPQPFRLCVSNFVFVCGLQKLRICRKNMFVVDFTLSAFWTYFKPIICTCRLIYSRKLAVDSDCILILVFDLWTECFVVVFCRWFRCLYLKIKRLTGKGRTRVANHFYVPLIR